ncbi:hypothetical protein DL766_010316 [Monosporascus sp. MC13-8B]|uniref:Anaphase-promoting complex subunit 4 WD40 domain-containing protein n=1 Tax=Monosporascus cannonballus TaxID=155416 RepID=A0ABY0HF07_9PEZI|nr:hypothetical protein DL763_006459 [Monosporascus cannonballus]RYO89144.1 hypothetical protein DL762_003424 [Monosporascus cannonballus]RYP02489.1 hypothetical protein DL766_010316 [Monosporascus sp. MC13-8B]
MSSMITTSAWVPRGFAAPFPAKYKFDEAEFERIAELAKLQLDDANEDLEEAQEEEKNAASGAKTEGDSKTTESAADDNEPEEINIDDDDLKEYDLEHYDDDDDDAEGQSMDMFGNIKSLTYYENNKDDPYITIPDGEDEDDDDREELQILATDNLLLAAKVEDELAHLEVYVYEDEADNLYVHHDIMLPAIPLCVEWLDIPVAKPSVEQDSTANFVAIGTMDPDIEVWDLDTVDCMYPNAILGQGGNPPKDEEKKKKKKKKSKKANDEYHIDAVLSLAANRKHRNLLASASADKTVKLWDLNTTKCAKSYSYHTDKVCSLAWHSVESTVLLSGSYDRTVVAADMRAPEAQAPRWGVESDVENVRWDPHDQHYFYVSTENGIIHYHDVRNAPSSPTASKPVWTLQAHDQSLSSFDINAHIPGYVATGSTDKTVKLWNIQPTGPAMVVSRNLDVGKVFSTTFAPDAEVAFRLAVAGSKGTLHVWDTSTNAAIRQAFAHKIADKSEGEVKERLVGVTELESSSEEEDGDDDDQEGESMDED